MNTGIGSIIRPLIPTSKKKCGLFCAVLRASRRLRNPATVECKVRPIGNPDKPRMEYRCSDYYWNVEKQMEDYVNANGLED
jgi:hypothetical protein